MSEQMSHPFVPVEIPAGLEPRWERRYKGRMRYELDALQSAGITPVPDSGLLGKGVLALTFDWALDSETTIQLKAIYPDEFPHLRPTVLLLSGLDPLPLRHISPLEGTLCLLGRDSRQWIASWSLHHLLREQLHEAIYGSQDEDPQGEPADFWWNALAPEGSYCLIDSRWSIGAEEEGTLGLRYVIDRLGKNGDPVFRAVTTEVTDSKGHTIHSWEGHVPHDLAAGKPLTVGWIRQDAALLPRSDLGALYRELDERYHMLQRSQLARFGSKQMLACCAVAHPVEIGFGEIGLGWVFFLVWGSPRSFPLYGRRKPTGQARPPMTVRVLQSLRAGPEDLGSRAPAVKLLRRRKILVVGTGAVGAPLVVELARCGCGDLYVLDGDRVEPGNSVRWPLGVSAWGRDKVSALEELVQREYPGTRVHAHMATLGSAGGQGNGKLIEQLVSSVDLVIDGTASYGVTMFLADQCAKSSVPMISLFATPTLGGGAVARFSGDGGCPNCLEYEWDRDDIGAPPGWGMDSTLFQPPGCSERTFSGASYDLQELSLQATRLAVETLSTDHVEDSIVQILSFVDEKGQRCPPRWTVHALPKRPECTCHA